VKFAARIRYLLVPHGQITSGWKGHPLRCLCGRLFGSHLAQLLLPLLDLFVARRIRVPVSRVGFPVSTPVFSICRSQRISHVSLTWRTDRPEVSSPRWIDIRGCSHRHFGDDEGDVGDDGDDDYRGRDRWGALTGTNDRDEAWAPRTTCRWCDGDDRGDVCAGLEIADDVFHCHLSYPSCDSSPRDRQDDPCPCADYLPSMSSWIRHDLNVFDGALYD